MFDWDNENEGILAQHPRVPTPAAVEQEAEQVEMSAPSEPAFSPAAEPKIEEDSSGDESSATRAEKEKNTRVAHATTMPPSGTLIALHMQKGLTLASDFKSLVSLNEEVCPAHAGIEKWGGGEYNELLRAAAEIMLDDSVTEYPAAYLTAKLLNFFGIKVTSDLPVHGSIPVLPDSELPLRHTVKAVNTSSHEAKEITEVMQDTFGSSTCCLLFEYDSGFLKTSTMSTTNLRFLEALPAVDPVQLKQHHTGTLWP